MMIRLLYCCMDCGNQINIRTALYGKGRCKYCYYKYLNGENNPNFKGLIKLNCQYCKKIMFRYPSRLRNRHNKELSYYNCSPLCQIHYLRKFKSGRNSIGYGRKTNIYTDILYKTQLFRSSWEANFAKWLDLSNIKWLYESKTFDLGNTTYTPDFYLPEFDCYIEIKGRWFPNSKRKVIKFQKLYSNLNFKIYYKKELMSFGIINDSLVKL